MKKQWIAILTFLIMVITLSGSCSQGNGEDFDYVEGDPVLLRWKVPNKDYLAFKMSMDPVNPNQENYFRFNIDELADAVDIPEDTKEKIDGFSLPNEFSMTAILKSLPNDNLSVKMILNKATYPASSGSDMDEAMKEMMKSMEGTVQLRGEITDSGEIESFYYEQKQKNLIALLFELPEEPVNVGDVWQLDVSLLFMGAGFIGEEAKRSNRVELVSLTETEDGDVIATINYLVAESVDGKFVMPAMGFGGSKAPEPKDSYMGMSFVGRGEFLVGAGTWKSFTGRMNMKATGMMQSDAQQIFGLEPVEEVSRDLLNLE